MTVIVALLACSGGDFSGMLAADLSSGVLLGGHSDGDQALLVGGDFGGIGTIVRWDGKELCVEAETVEQVLWWSHGVAEGDWYAVGANGIVVREQGGERSREDIDTEEALFGVYDDGTDVWAVSSDIFESTGTIWRKPAGGEWTSVLETPDLMFKVWQRWFVGNGLAYYWDGTELVERHPPDGVRLTTVRGRSDDDVWAVGGLVNPVVIHWDGTAWSDVPWEPRCGGQNGINGVWTAEGEDVWVAGHVGTAASWDGEEWSCNEGPVTSDDFHFVWHHGGDWLFGGGNLFTTSDNYGALAMHPSPRKPVELTTCP